jgi:LysR family transcriptional regulator, low CO2-responsive transcriptional regulator
MQGRRETAPLIGQNDFTIHQLIVFRTVARHLSYTRAAGELYLSQPAVSQHIRTLEQALGVYLFKRSGRGIALTDAGQEVLEQAERLLTLFGETATVVREIQVLQRGSVLLGATISAGTYLVPPLLGMFHARYPGVHVTLIVANYRDVEECLIKYELDLAVMSTVERRDFLQVVPFIPYVLVVIAPPTHHLVQRATVTACDVQEETFLLHQRETASRRCVEEYFAREGITLQSTLEMGSIDAIKEGVIAGLGIAVVEREAIALEIASGELVILDVEGFPLQRPTYVVHLEKRGLSLAAKAFRQHLLEQAVGIGDKTGN